MFSFLFNLVMVAAMCCAAVPMPVFASGGQPAPQSSNALDDHSSVSPPTVRRIVSLNAGWRFFPGESPDAAQPNLDDSKWQSIDLPHTWNVSDGQDGGNDYQRGVGWYRRTISVDSETTSRRVFLRFGAANTVAEVFLDGQSIGTHRGGYAAFCFEVTQQLKPGQPHLLAVKVDNSRYDEVPPYSADYTFFGGLYRGAELLITDPLCISPLDYASPGVCVRQVELTDERAIVEVRTLISNGRSKAAHPRIEAHVIGADGIPAAKTSKLITVAADSVTEARQTVTIVQPRLWEGRSDPYLYKVLVRILDGERVIDQVEQPLGLRTFRVDPDRGFFLNDKPLDLHGVNRHQDRIDMGWALTRRQHEEDIALIREMGCTMVRLAHYQQDEYVYGLCDRAGLVVWAEIPLVNRIVDTPQFAANCRQQLTELIRQNYNHPSICFWGVHNEVTGAWEPGPDPAKLVGELAALARREDPTRLSVCAATDPVDDPSNWQTDLTAFNRYFGWYVGRPEDLGEWLDKTHAAHPQTPIGISEYGAGASISAHQLPAKMPKHNGQFHPEEWQAHLHETQWLAMKERDYLWCKLVWNMFDFASDARAEGDHPGRNDKGLVTYDRRVKKDAFYWYKSRWSDEPVVYITSRRYEPRTDPVTQVKVYSNCEKVDLIVDGKSQGSREGKDGIFRWPDVKLNPGRNTVEAIGVHNGATHRDQCVWTLRTKDE